MNDNDIRHIKNSHGEGTKEKYPVTAKDIKKIPDIIENYDDILYVPRKDGKAGIVFVKRHNGVTYYLEQISNGQELYGKQMIKTSTGTIPKIEGLEDAIHKKWGTTPLQMAKAPRMYVQDVWNDTATDSISHNTVTSQASSFDVKSSFTPSSHPELFTDGKLDINKVNKHFMPSSGSISNYGSLMTDYYEAGKAGKPFDLVKDSGMVRIPLEATPIPLQRKSIRRVF